MMAHLGRARQLSVPVITHRLTWTTTHRSTGQHLQALSFNELGEVSRERHLAVAGVPPSPISFAGEVLSQSLFCESYGLAICLF